MEGWEHALQKFIEYWIGKDEVIGIMLVGSYAVGNSNKYSDVDIHIALSDGVNWRERGNKEVNGYLIEYFINPLRQIYAYFDDEIKGYRRPTVRMYATGKILFDKNGSMEKLKSYAKLEVEKRLREPSKLEIENMKYHIWDSCDDLKALYEESDLSFDYVYYNNLNTVLECYRKYLRCEITSISKLYKYLSDRGFKEAYEIEWFPDEVFVEKFIRCMDLKNIDDRFAHFNKLVNYVLGQMGGFKIDGWNLRSEVTG